MQKVLANGNWVALMAGYSQNSNYKSMSSAVQEQ